MPLNPSQETAITTCGLQLVLAGPGSGKTRVITEKILHLIDLGVRPEQILALTFSDKAAAEMSDRIALTGAVFLDAQKNNLNGVIEAENVLNHLSLKKTIHV
jgi:superfamily I DNA/RNA helicase